MTVKMGPNFSADHLSSIDDALQALETLNHNLQKTELDRLKNFNQAYLIITRNVRTAMRKRAFNDPEFLSAFDARFAYYYFNALEAYLTGRETPKAWKVAFEASRSERNSPLTCMALGINAHINNDIPQVLHDTKATSKHHDDYKLINKIIEDSIYEVIEALDHHQHVLNPKRAILKPVYKFSMKWLAKLWRFMAWHHYQSLSRGRSSIADIELTARRIANGIIKLPV